MASHEYRVLVDDLDGSPALTTVRFSYAGADYEIDLSQHHAEELGELLDRYIARARRVEAPPATVVRYAWVPLAKVRRDEAAAIRAWADGQGISLPARGIPRSVLEVYRARA